MDEYLRLNLPEQQQFEGYIARLQPEEQESVTMITTSWKEEALSLIERQLFRWIGHLTEQGYAQVQQLTLSQLEQLGEDLLDFCTPADLTQWLEQNT